MKKKLFLWQLGGFIFTGIMGVLLHFLFDITGESVFVAPFSAVNESIWEHMKLLFFPMLVFVIAESRFIGNEYKSFWCAKLIGILLGMFLIPVLYYTINGALGQVPDWVNVLIFYIAVAVGYITETAILTNQNLNCKSPTYAKIVLISVAVIFAILTFVPPELPIFEDPVTKTYGFFG